MSTQQPPTKKIKLTKKIKIFSSDILVNEIPYEVWRDVICPTLGYSDRLNLNATCNEFVDTFGDYKQKFLGLGPRLRQKKHAIHVPQDVRTIEKAMELVRKLQMVPTEKNPLKIVLDKGVHEIVGYEDMYEEYHQWLYVHHNHITFVGKGKDHTTIHGGFFVGSRYRSKQNVKFEEMTITNYYGKGLHLEGSETTVAVLKCAVKDCAGDGMMVRGGATVTATQCEFMENINGVYGHEENTKVILNDCTMHHNLCAGLQAYDHAVVDLHGTKTDIHSNSRGILADGAMVLGAKVNIHLPSQHNTSHGNVKGDRVQWDWGSIANINDDGTFTHPEEDDFADWLLNE